MTDYDKDKCARCDGTGRIEIYKGCQVEPWAGLWAAEEAIEPSEDGVHRVKCADCGGAGYK
jgi:hypothetical protein